MPRALTLYLLGTVGVILALLPLHAFLSTWGGTAVGPLELWKSWKELLLLPAIFALIAWVVWRGLVQELLSDLVIRLIVLYTVLVLGLTLWHQQANGIDATLAGLAFDLRYLVMFVIAYVVVRYSRLPAGLLKRVHLVLVGVGVGLAVLGLLQVTVIPRDFLSQFGYEKFVTIAPYLTIDEMSPDIIRAFATLRGPNDYGAYLVMTLALALTAPLAMRYRMGASVLMLAGIAASHSRSAYIAAAVVLAAWVVMTYGLEWIKKHWYVVIFLVAAAVGFVATAFLSPTVRLIVFHSSEYDTHLTEGSIDDRGDAILGAMQRVLANPLGCGAGCSGPASYYGDKPLISENYYLQIAEQHGVIGLGLWMAIFLVIMQRLYLRAKKDPLALALFCGGLGLAVIGLMLHVWVDDPLSMTWWALVGAALGTGAIAAKNPSQRSLRGK